MSEEQQNSAYIAENESAEADSIFGDAPRSEQQAEKTGGMSKNAKVLLACGCLLLGLAAGTAAAVLLLKNDDGGADPDSVLDSLTDPDEKAGLLLNEGVADNVSEIRISNADTFTVKRLTAELTAAEQYGIEGWEDIRLDQNLVSTLAKNGSQMEAAELVEENPADPAKYGLADPAATVDIDYVDGIKFHLLVGDKSPMDAAKTYCMAGDKVYLVNTSLVANYQKAPEAFISNVVLAEPEQDVYPIVENVRITRKDLDWDMYMEYDYANAEDDSIGGTAATHVLREPLFSYLSVDRSVDVTNGMFGLEACEIAQVHPTEADLKRAGLDDPFCTVVMNCDNGESYTLTIGDTYENADGKTLYYTYLAGENLLYGVTAEEDIWATVQPGDITSANIFNTYVWNIKTLDVSARGEERHFTCDGNGSDDTGFEVKEGTKEIETERFRLLYRFLLNIYGEEMCFEELPDREPDGEVHITTLNGREDYTISFYQISDLKMMVARDGVPSYIIRTSCLDTLAYNLSVFDDASQSFRESWQ